MTTKFCVLLTKRNNEAVVPPKACDGGMVHTDRADAQERLDEYRRENSKNTYELNFVVERT